MAVDKLVDSAQLDEDLTSVANAIRFKADINGELVFPSGFVNAIGNISPGVNVEPLTVTEGGTYTAPEGTAYSPVTVNVSGGGQYAWFGEGAEKVGTVINRTINLKNDTPYDSWTASTTATTLIAEETSNSYTVDLTLSDYDYCFITKGYLEPVYLAGTPMKTTTKKICQYYMHYIFGYMNPNSTENVKTNTPDSCSLTTIGSSMAAIQFCYNNVGSIISRSATQCGPIYMSSYPSISTVGSSVVDGIVTVGYKFKAFNAKCDTTRFTIARKDQVDSANTNYVITVDLFRVPRGKGLFSHLISEMVADLNA